MTGGPTGWVVAGQQAPGPLGASVVGHATQFVVWAPDATRVDVLIGTDGDRVVPMVAGAAGYWTATIGGAGHDTRYRFALDGGAPLPDPASARQPDGVHGASAVVDPSRFEWTADDWRGRTLADTVLYELHVGTFTPDGTLDAAIAELDRLAALGVTTIELMPVNAFPGERNWGYDGVFPYAVHESYGGPDALARFVDAAHVRGLAVVLDVVYNHLGPEGNRLADYGPYFTDAYTTPWGAAVNVAGAGSDGVRRFFVENAVRWIRDFRVDGFRFDAVHAIVDPTADPFWGEVCRACRAAALTARRRIVLIAESSDNDPRQLHAPEVDGIGFDAVWCDDVHHSLRVAATGDRRGYYVDYTGSPAELADTVTHRWRFRGQYSAARERRHGRPVDDVSPHRFIACSQNHDQVGNRPAGERPDHHVDDARRRFAPAFVLLSPYTPMLFQGEEYGERRPFPFFVDHTDPEILRATNEGRRAEFAGADWSVDVPEPGDPATFDSAVLDPSLVERDERAAGLLAMYTELLRLRRELPPVAAPAARQRVVLDGDVVVVERTLDGTTTRLLANPSDRPAPARIDGEVRFSSDDERWGGGGADGLPAWTVLLTTST